MRTSRLLGAVVVVVVVTGCGDGSSSSSPATSAPSPAPTPSGTAAPTPTSTLPPGVDQVVTISYANGTVTGPKRFRVKLGNTVQLVVTSDKADEVHLHGYDKTVDVVPGTPARLTVKATIPGIFEVELEKLHKTLVRLQVQ